MELNVLNGTHYVYVIIFVHLLFEVKPFSVARSEFRDWFCNVNSYACLRER